jgi:hypothetical protein
MLREISCAARGRTQAISRAGYLNPKTKRVRLPGWSVKPGTSKSATVFFDSDCNCSV